MKQILSISAVVLLVAMVALPGVASAQDNAWHQKDMNLSAGVGFGMYGLYGSSTLPPIFVSFETGVAEKITLGGIVAYSGSSDDFGYGKWKYTYIVIGARGAYHFLEHNPKFDAYAGAGLGYDIVSASVTWNNGAYQSLYGNFYSASASYFFFDVFVGGRWYFSPKWALQGEVGYGVGFARIGVSYKLN
jgi:hypothetical protein